MDIEEIIEVLDADQFVRFDQFTRTFVSWSGRWKQGGPESPTKRTSGLWKQTFLNPEHVIEVTMIAVNGFDPLVPLVSELIVIEEDPTRVWASTIAVIEDVIEKYREAVTAREREDL